MAIADHWIIKESTETPRETRDRYTTVAAARAAAIAAAQQSPGKTILVYRFVKAAVAPPAAVQESDPVV
jgi:hypothetical protein